MAYRGESAGDGAPGAVQSTVRRRSDAAREPWWAANRAIQFYGVVPLAGTKAADAVTTAVGLYYLPAVVEPYPVANAAFAGKGTLLGIVLLSFAVVLFSVFSAELLAMELRRRLGLYRPALVGQATVYGSLATLFWGHAQRRPARPANCLGSRRAVLPLTVPRLGSPAPGSVRQVSSWSARSRHGPSSPSRSTRPCLR